MLPIYLELDFFISLIFFFGICTLNFGRSRYTLSKIRSENHFIVTVLAEKNKTLQVHKQPTFNLEGATTS